MYRPESLPGMTHALLTNDLIPRVSNWSVQSKRPLSLVWTGTSIANLVLIIKKCSLISYLFDILFYDDKKQNCGKKGLKVVIEGLELNLKFGSIHKKF